MSLTTFAIVFVCIFLPIGLGVAICRALRVREFTFRTVMVLLTISFALAPFLGKIIQDERRTPGGPMPNNGSRPRM